MEELLLCSFLACQGATHVKPGTRPMAQQQAPKTICQIPVTAIVFMSVACVYVQTHTFDYIF